MKITAYRIDGRGHKRFNVPYDDEGVERIKRIALVLHQEHWTKVLGVRSGYKMLVLTDEKNKLLRGEQKLLLTKLYQSLPRGSKFPLVSISSKFISSDPSADDTEKVSILLQSPGYMMTWI